MFLFIVLSSKPNPLIHSAIFLILYQVTVKYWTTRSPEVQKSKTQTPKGDGIYAEIKAQVSKWLLQIHYHAAGHPDWHSPSPWWLSQPVVICLEFPLSVHCASVRKGLSCSSGTENVKGNADNRRTNWIVVSTASLWVTNTREGWAEKETILGWLL